MEENVRECKSKRLIQGGFIVKFKTENLYLIQLQELDKFEIIGNGRELKYFKKDYRYTLARKDEKCIHKSYIDIFTNTVYEIPFYVDSKGHPAVTKAEPIITNTEYLTEEEALRILKELNPTYLKEVEKENTKRLRLFK